MMNTVKKYLGFILIAILALMPVVPAYGADNQPVAIVWSVTNNVQISADNQNWKKAELGDKLYVGDHITTGVKSNVEVSFLNTGSRLKMGPMSKIMLENDKNDVHLTFGKLFVSIVKGKGGMKTKSPVAVAAVLGTVGIIDYDPTANDYSVTSIDGTFAVTDINNNTANVTAGNVARLTSSGIAVEVANTIATIQANTQILSPDFIKTGLPANSIKVNQAGQEVLQLDTASPKEKIEINSQSGDMNTFQINQNNVPVTQPQNQQNQQGQQSANMAAASDTSSTIMTINSNITTINSSITTINSAVTTVNSGIPVF